MSRNEVKLTILAYFKRIISCLNIITATVNNVRLQPIPQPFLPTRQQW